MYADKVVVYSSLNVAEVHLVKSALTRQGLESKRIGERNMSKNDNVNDIFVLVMITIVIGSMIYSAYFS